MAQLSAEVTHNHPEGIKGAEATAGAILLSRTGSAKAEIKNDIQQQFHYRLSRTCDEIRPTYRHVESCQEIPMYPRMQEVPDLKRKTLQEFVDAHVKQDSTVECDGFQAYPGLKNVAVDAKVYDSTSGD